MKENKLFHRSFFGPFPCQRNTSLACCQNLFYTGFVEGLQLPREAHFWSSVLFVGNNISEDGQGIVELAILPEYLPDKQHHLQNLSSILQEHNTRKSNALGIENKGAFSSSKDKKSSLSGMAGKSGRVQSLQIAFLCHLEG